MTNSGQRTTREGSIGIAVSEPKTTLVRVYDVVPPDAWYTTVLVQFLGAEHEVVFEVRMGGVEAQKLGHALNRAGGGTL